MKIIETKCFKSSDNIKHDSKLQALIAQRRIDVRAILQGDAKTGKAHAITHSEAADAIISNVEEISKVISQYKAAINRERTKANSIPAVKSAELIS